MEIQVDILVRAIAGGIAIGLVLLISKKFGPIAAGLFALFPIVSLPIYYFIGTTEGNEKLRLTLFNSLLAFPIWIIFTVTLYWACHRFKIIPAMLIALGIWTIAAILFLLIRKAV